jgi:two-component system nitrate/nitrite response regulator NarL
MREGVSRGGQAGTQGRMSSVLVVDDDAAFREQLELLVAELRPQAVVVGVADAHAAVARALELRPDHVLLDYALPGPNGLNVATAIAQALPATRIVIVSGTDEIDETSVPDGVRFVRKGAGLRDAVERALAA